MLRDKQIHTYIYTHKKLHNYLILPPKIKSLLHDLHVHDFTKVSFTKFTREVSGVNFIFLTCNNTCCFNAIPNRVDLSVLCLSSFKRLYEQSTKSKTSSIFSGDKIISL